MDRLTETSLPNPHKPELFSSDPEFAPKYLPYHTARKVAGDHFDTTDHSVEDTELRAVIERCRNGILETLTEHFRVEPDDVVMLPVSTSELGRRQRDCFAWMAVHDPETHKLFYSDGRVAHDMLILKLVAASHLDTDLVDRITMQFLLRAELFDHGDNVADDAVPVDETLPVIIDGVFSLTPLRMESSRRSSEPIHTILRTPLPRMN